MAFREGRRCCERYDALMERLPAYEAAVEALERLVAVLGPATIKWTDPVPEDSLWALTDAREALRRLRDEVPV